MRVVHNAVVVLAVIAVLPPAGTTGHTPITLAASHAAALVSTGHVLVAGVNAVVLAIQAGYSIREVTPELLKDMATLQVAAALAGGRS